MKRILITGINSYLGKCFKRYIEGFPGYATVSISMRDGSWRDEDFTGIDTVYHVAGLAHSDNGHISAEKALAVKAEAETPHILPVQLRLDRDGQLVPPVYLRPAGETWLDVICAVFIPLGDQVGLIPQRGARADHRHLPGEDVEKLGKLVKTCAAQERASFCDPLRRVGQQVRGHVLGRVRAHSAEFQDIEKAFMDAEALLPEEHRPRRAKLYGRRYQQHRYSQHGDARQRKQHIQRSFYHTLVHNSPHSDCFSGKVLSSTTYNNYKL